MSDNSKLAIGACVGTVAGFGAGFGVGMKKSAKTLEQYKPVINLEIGSDEFKKAKQAFAGKRVEENIGKVLDNCGNDKDKMFKTYKKVYEEACKNFKKMAEEAPSIKKVANGTKAKWAIALAAAGALVGAGVVFAANKIKAIKAEKAEA